MTSQQDPRIAELLELATEQGQPLGLRPETVCALEDAGWMVDPFTGLLQREDPSCLPPVHTVHIREVTGSMLGGGTTQIAELMTAEIETINQLLRAHGVQAITHRRLTLCAESSFIAYGLRLAVNNEPLSSAGEVTP